MSISEMEGFLAVVMNMGVIQVPDITSYWSTNWLSAIPFFGRMFSRERFEQVFWMLHVSHCDPDLPEKRIDKVKMVLELLITNFKKSFSPKRNLAVDETIDHGGVSRTVWPEAIHAKQTHQVWHKGLHLG